MTTKLIYDDGLRTYELPNGKTIRFNPTDPNIYKRCVEAFENAKKLEDELRAQKIDLDTDGKPKQDTAIEIMQQMDAEIRKLTDYALNAEVSEAVYGQQSVFALVANGEYLFISFLDCIAKLATQEMERSFKGNKYTNKYRNKKKRNKPGQKHG